VRKVMEGYVEVCAWLLAAMLGASVLIGFGLSRLALRPMRLMRETANRIRSDNLSERIPVMQVQDEVSDLARLLNRCSTAWNPPSTRCAISPPRPRTS